MARHEGNIYKTARLKASLTQEQAAEELLLSVESISAYETGQRVPNPSIVLDMAAVYNAPELRSQHCAMSCPIGAIDRQCLDVAELDRVTLQLCSAWRHGDKMKDMLLDITEDGVIETDEMPQLSQVVAYLDGLAKTAAELKLWVERNMDRC